MTTREKKRMSKETQDNNEANTNEAGDNTTEQTSNTSSTQDRVFEGEAEVLETKSASSEEKNWAMISHISAFVALIPLLPVIGMVLGPLIVWLLKKEDMPLVAENGKAALNFNIGMFIAYCVAILLCFIIIGIPLLFGLVIFHFIVTVMAAIKASEGGVYKYPFTLKLVQ